MNKNIMNVLEKIVESYELLRGFVQQESMDDIYKYCSEIEGGYTRDELEEEFSELLKLCFGDDIYELSENDIENVAGGQTSKFNKILAGTLSALMMYSGGVEIHGAGNTKFSKATHFDKKPDSFWQRHGKKIKIAIGTTVGVAIAAFVGWKIHDVGKRKREKVKELVDVQNKLRDEYSKKLEVIAGDNAEADKLKLKREYDSLGMMDQAKLNELQKINETKDDKLHNMGFFFKSLGKEIPGDSNPSGGFWGMIKGGGWTGPLAVLPFFASGVIHMVEDISKFSKHLGHLANAKYNMERVSEDVQDYVTQLNKKTAPENIDLKSAKERLDMAFDQVIGQEKAKRAIAEGLTDILRRKDHAKRMGYEYNTSDAFYFTGPSGVGKSLLAGLLARFKVFGGGSTPFVVSSGNIDKKSGRSAIEQLFGSAYYSSYGGNKKSRSSVIQETPSLVKYINDNPDGGVIIFDEYDKCHDPSLDEFFRSALDNGTLTISGKKVNCRGFIFIFISNENADILRMGNYDDVDMSKLKDVGGSTTIVRHDKSFINRVKIADFENLSNECYASIAEGEYKFYIQDYWALPTVAGLKIIMDDEFFKNIAVAVRRANEGARYIKKLQGGLFLEINTLAYTLEAAHGKEYLKDKEITVKFDAESEKFTLFDKDKKLLNAENIVVIPKTDSKSDSASTVSPGNTSESKKPEVETIVLPEVAVAAN